jgi:hypothetical protein
MDRPGVLLVRRVRWWAEKLAQRPRDGAVGLTEDQVARAYRGIDGRPWPDELPAQIPRTAGLAPLEYWPEVTALAVAGSGNIYDALILAPSPVPPANLDVELLGFDFGFYEGESSVFSSIFHEALHSPVAELRRWAPCLNAALLLPGLAQVDAYRRERESLLARGADLEGGDCYAIAIFRSRH